MSDVRSSAGVPVPLSPTLSATSSSASTTATVLDTHTGAQIARQPAQAAQVPHHRRRAYLVLSGVPAPCRCAVAGGVVELCKAGVAVRGAVGGDGGVVLAIQARINDLPARVLGRKLGQDRSQLGAHQEQLDTVGRVLCSHGPEGRRVGAPQHAHCRLDGCDRRISRNLSGRLWRHWPTRFPSPSSFISL
ncbi:hypothetical protein L1887_57903 [Cichorium endivia]|nr:hypothetical protein L1887_57903 [Cichorium endivia]